MDSAVGMVANVSKDRQRSQCDLLGDAGIAGRVLGQINQFLDELWLLDAPALAVGEGGKSE